MSTPTLTRRELLARLTTATAGLGLSSAFLRYAGIADSQRNASQSAFFLMPAYESMGTNLQENRHDWRRSSFI